MEATIYTGKDYIKVFNEKNIQRLINALAAPAFAPKFIFISDPNNSTCIINIDSITRVEVTDYVPNFLKESEDTE